RSDWSMTWNRWRSRSRPGASGWRQRRSPRQALASRAGLAETQHRSGRAEDKPGSDDRREDVLDGRGVDPGKELEVDRGLEADRQQIRSGDQGRGQGAGQGTGREPLDHEWTTEHPTPPPKQPSDRDFLAPGGGDATHRVGDDDISDDRKQE